MISATSNKIKTGAVADDRKDAFSDLENTGFCFAGWSWQFHRPYAPDR
jgi:hypothetical protein